MRPFHLAQCNRDFLRFQAYKLYHHQLMALYSATPENRQKLLGALNAMQAEWERPLTEAILQRQTVFALNTKFGDLDIFTTVPGVQDYEEAARSALFVEMGGQRCRILNLSILIAAKEAAGDPNPRKQSALSFLKALQNTRN